MPEHIVESIQVKRLDILDEQGNADGALAPSLTDDALKRMYELLVLSRTFDQRALNLQREGRLGTYPSLLGQEASQVGSALAAEKTDWIFPTFREAAVYITAGLPMDLLYQYWEGDERGMKIPEGLNIFPLCIPVGTQVPMPSARPWPRSTGETGSPFSLISATAAYRRGISTRD